MARSISKKAMSQFDMQMFAMERKKRDFEVAVTSYTRMIKEEGSTMLFASDFKNTSNHLLPLINKIRKDGAKYMEDNFVGRDERIDYSKLLDTPVREKTICKIDINGAYWNYALREGIISKDTDDYCNKVHEGLSYKKLKDSRLKGLGSLATRKMTYVYRDGKEVVEERKQKIEATRHLYIEICRGIDMMMKQCAREVKGVVYYYWDCIFVDKQFSNEVVDFFRKLEYDCTIEETKLDFVMVGQHGYLISKADGKMYLVRKEDRHLLDTI